MPYIKKEQRKEVWEPEVSRARTPGELNYIFTMAALCYIKHKGKKYQHFNDVIGALECCKQELYRRFIAPYEDKKIKENGDIL